MDELVDPAFLAAVEHLRLVVRRVARGGRPAERRSRALGHGMEFRDFRPYVPGDDLRSIDWNIYQRLGRVVLRLYEELEDLPLRVLVDVSGSMHMEDPPRARAGMQAAMALAAIALNHHDRVTVQPFGQGVHATHRVGSGRHRMLDVARHLADAEIGGPTDLAAAARTMQRRRARPGLLVIVSDFFDPRGLEHLRKPLGRVRDRMVWVALERAADRAPTLDGDVRLLDAEGGAARDLTITADVRRRYLEAYGAHQAALDELAQRMDASLLRLDADAPVVAQLARAFESGAVRA